MFPFYRFNPCSNDPNRDFFFVTSPDANRILPLLVDALPDVSPAIVEGKTAKFLDGEDPAFTLQSAGKHSIFSLINKASRFGRVDARSILLRHLRPTDDDDRAALRRLCTGAPEAGDANADIWVLEGVLDSLERSSCGCPRAMAGAIFSFRHA